MNKIISFTFLIWICFQNCFGQCNCSGNTIAIQNPSLNGAASNMNNSTKPTSWSSYGDEGAGLGTSAYSIDCASILAPSCNGDSFARMLSNGSNYNEGISQIINGLTIGDLYYITFSQALVAHGARSTGFFNVTFCGTTLSSPSIALPSCVPCQTPWSTVSIGPFLATATSHSLIFVAHSNNDGDLSIEASLPLGMCTNSNSPECADLQLDGISICKESPLIIELLNFDVKVNDNNSVSLEWEMAAEIDNDYFTIERSFNGTNWAEIIKIDGSGNSSVHTNYTVTDNNPYQGMISYYRLKQTSFDGKFKYSKTKTVVIEAAKASLKLYPNPTESQITIIGDENELEKLRIYNLLGQDITTLTRYLINSKSQLIINLSNLNTGVYYVKTKTTTYRVYRL